MVFFVAVMGHYLVHWRKVGNGKDGMEKNEVSKFWNLLKQCSKVRSHERGSSIEKEKR